MRQRQQSRGSPPPWVGIVVMLAVLLVASTAFLAVTTIIFKRLEPTFAKVV